MLRNLVDSALASQVVRKNDTSLSNAYRLVDRFLEAVDLAGLLAGRTLAAVKALLRDVQQVAVARGTALALPKVLGNSERGHIRRVYNWFYSPPSDWEELKIHHQPGRGGPALPPQSDWEELKYKRGIKRRF